jgi:hypothetical protein
MRRRKRYFQRRRKRYFQRRRSRKYWSQFDSEGKMATEHLEFAKTNLSGNLPDQLWR